jgi:hypothetical protein
MSPRGWFLINAALTVGASASVYLIKPKIWLVVVMFVGMCLLHAWMWLVGKVVEKVRSARRVS